MYLEENNLLCPNHSGFTPSDSYEYQLQGSSQKIMIP